MQMRRAPNLRTRLQPEEGFTLVEMVVAMGILSLVLIVFFSTLSAIQGAVARQDNLSQTNDQARLALQELDREIRSANIIYDPATESYKPSGIAVSGFALRAYTQSNYGTGRSTYVCALWQITTSQALQVRTWPPQQPSQATAWRTVAEGIVNSAVPSAASPTPAFSLSSSGFTVSVTLLVNRDLLKRPTQTETLQGAVTGRNISYGFPSSLCSATPS
jgi:prepilin-type N-terminal cleavage/methylation domain-containing protein